ncbi:MAG TPA: hypothetical protein VFB21_18605 [Chthonomonadaceae bacterium]|nr:hypothetical protein [Chthonomonadaceae bacterium]
METVYLTPDNSADTGARLCPEGERKAAGRAGIPLNEALDRLIVGLVLLIAFVLAAPFGVYFASRGRAPRLSPSVPRPLHSPLLSPKAGASVESVV